MSDAPSYTQAGRLLRIDTPLGEDVLLLEKFDGEEEVSELFAFTAVVRSKRTDLQASDLVGKLVDVSLALYHGEQDGGPDEQLRTWNLLCVALHEGEMVARTLRHYTLTLRPQLWLLTRRADCRIWLDKTSTEVCEALLAEHGLPAPDSSGLVSPVAPPKRDYSVQWNETDLAYLDRRLEQDGTFYYFTHAMGRHVMQLANHQAAYQDLQPEPALRMARGSTDRNHIFAFDRTYHFIPSARAGRDWNFETPGRPPDGQAASTVRGQIAGGAGGAKYELYEYPGRFMDSGGGEGALRQRMQAAETEHDQVVGQTRVRSLVLARRFTPNEVPHPERVFEPHVATRIEHHASDPTYDTGSAGAAARDAPVASPSYTNGFDATPASVPATPHRDTHQPRIDGAQIAIIAGPAGEEIHTDRYGRVKLRFPWDRHARGDGSDTVWVRVGQPWAGGTWGAQVIPRVGMEVLVTYQDGDPDRPLVTGVVPNPHNPVPWKLPSNKTRTVLRTNTYKGSGFNELYFEDVSNGEEVCLRAQLDYTIKVQNNATARVDCNKVTSVGGSFVTEVARNITDNVGQNYTVNVGIGPAGGVVRAKLLEDPYGIRAAGYFITDSAPLATGSGNFAVNANANISLKSTESLFLNVGQAQYVNVAETLRYTVGNSIFSSAQQDHREVVGKTKMIDAHGEICLRCGDSEITMKPDGTITIKGRKIFIEGSAIDFMQRGV